MRQERTSVLVTARKERTMRYRFNAFGRIIAVERVDDAWDTYLMGNEGKRRPAGFAVPSDVTHRRFELSRA